MNGKTALREAGLQFLKDALRYLLSARMNDDVVCITLKPDTGIVLLHPSIKYYMQIEIG